MQKKFVSVIVQFDIEGNMRPLQILFDEEHIYAIDKVIDVRRAACESVGGVGLRYTCKIRNQERYLWHEKNRWFVEAKH